jgi:hypothetical protein
MSVFRPSARTTDPVGRAWEIYAFRLKLPKRLPPGDWPLEYQLETQAIGAVFWVLRAACVLLFRLVVDVPVAAMRAFGSDEWTISRQSAGRCS